MRRHSRGWPSGRRTQPVYVSAHSRGWPSIGTGRRGAARHRDPKPKKEQADQLEYEKDYYIKDQHNNVLSASLYDSVSEDEFVVVKGLETPRAGGIHYSGKRVLVMRKKDSKLYHIDRRNMVKQDIQLKKGNSFKARVITKTGYDEDLELRLRES